MTAMPTVRGTSFYQNINAVSTHTMTLPAGIQNGDTLAIFVAGANTLGTATVRLTVGATELTALASSQRSAGSNLIGYVAAATSAMSSATVTFVKNPAAGTFKVAMVAVVLAGASSTVAVQSGAFASVSTGKTTPSVSAPARSMVELSVASDNDTTSPGTTSWSPPAGITRLVQAAHGAAGGGPPWTSLTVGMATGRAYGGTIGSRLWTANQSNGGAVMTLGLVVPVTPARHVRHFQDGWQMIQQVGQ